MNLPSIANDVQKNLRDNAPSILTALGISGAIGTAYLTGVASWRASRRLSEGPPTEHMTKREIVEEVWDLYIPPVISGVLTVGCIIGANHVSSKRMAAAYSFAAISEKALSEYRDKVVERVGERKEQTMRDEIAQERVNANPSGQIIVSTGKVICYELFTDRYFESDMETIRRAQNDINAKMMRENYATLNDFYHLIGLKQTTDSGRIGWEPEKLLDLSFTSTLSEKGEPCLAFEYNYTKPL